MNLLDAIVKELEVAGIKPDSAEAKKLMAGLSNLTDVEVGDEPLGKLHLMTFDGAKGNPGLKKHFESEAFGQFARSTEDKMRATAKKYDVDIEAIIGDRTKPMWERAAAASEAIADAIKAKGGKGGGKEAEEIRAEWERKYSETVTAKDAEIERTKSELSAKIGEANGRILRMKLKGDLLGGKFGNLNSELPGFDLILDGITNKVLQGSADTEITLDNDNWVVMDKKTKSVATDPTSGKPVTIENAITPHIHEGFLRKTKEGEQRQRTQTTEDKDLSPTQKQKLAQLG